MQCVIKTINLAQNIVTLLIFHEFINSNKKYIYKYTNNQQVCMCNDLCNIGPTQTVKLSAFSMVLML